MAWVVLDTLLESGLRFAVMHDEERIATSGTRSDVDIVADSQPLEMISAIRDPLSTHDIHPILVWNYDADSASLFFSDSAADRGLQLDVVYGRTGLGNYGLLPEGLLGGAVTGTRWPRSDPAHEYLYLLQKRHVKRQYDRVDDLLAMADEFNMEALAKSSRAIFHPEVATSVISSITNERQPIDMTTRTRKTLVNIRRLSRRIVHPVGFWAEMQGGDADSVAVRIAERLAGVLPMTNSGRFDGSAMQRFNSVVQLARTIWRAGLYVSCGGRPVGVSPQLTVGVDGRQLDDVAQDVVAAMAARLTT